MSVIEFFKFDTIFDSERWNVGDSPRIKLMISIQLVGKLIARLMSTKCEPEEVEVDKKKKLNYWAGL